MSDGGDLEKKVCKEARHTLNQQIKRNESADRKAVGLFRLNLLIAGLILTFLTFAAGSDGIDMSQYTNVFSIFGLGFLFLSSVTAAMTYTSSTYDLGIDPGTIKEANNGEYDTVFDLDGDLSGLYREWLIHNQNVGSFNTYLITGSILLILDSMTLLIGGAMVGLSSLESSWLLYGLFFCTLVVLGAGNLLIYYAGAIFMRIFGE